MFNSAAAGNTRTERASQDGCFRQKVLGCCGARLLPADVSRWMTNKQVNRLCMYAVFVICRAPNDSIASSIPRVSNKTNKAIEGTNLCVFAVPVNSSYSDNPRYGSHEEEATWREKYPTDKTLETVHKYSCARVSE